MMIIDGYMHHLKIAQLAMTLCHYILFVGHFSLSGSSSVCSYNSQLEHPFFLLILLLFNQLPPLISSLKSLVGFFCCPAPHLKLDSSLDFICAEAIQPTETLKCY